MHRTIEPTILYFGTPVALISSVNEDGVEESLLTSGNHGHRPHVDPARWRPLIMSFCRFFGLGGEVYPSRLASSEFMRFVTRAGN